MNALAVVVAGIAGSLLGAYINYFLSLTLGRTFILRYGRYFFFSEEKFLALEKAFHEHGRFATFFGRLIFGIRQWISIPAGLSKMPLLPFSLLTAAGAGIWVAILVSLGYALHEVEQAGVYAKSIGYWLVGAIVVISIAYFYWWTPRARAKRASSSTELNGSSS